MDSADYANNKFCLKNMYAQYYTSYAVLLEKVYHFKPQGRTFSCAQKELHRKIRLVVRDKRCFYIDQDQQSHVSNGNVFAAGKTLMRSRFFERCHDCLSHIPSTNECSSNLPPPPICGAAQLFTTRIPRWLAERFVRSNTSARVQRYPSSLSPPFDDKEQRRCLSLPRARLFRRSEYMEIDSRIYPVGRSVFYRKSRALCLGVGEGSAVRAGARDRYRFSKQ